MPLIEQKLLKDAKNRFDDFIGLSFEEIAFEVGINPELISSKLSIVILLNKMLEHKNINKSVLTEAVKPMDFSIKTVRLEESGKPKESMSFEQVDFLNLSIETWETSFLRNKLSNTIFLFLVFQYQKQKSESKILIFRGMKFWEMPSEILDSEVKKMWKKTNEIVLQGVKIEEINTVKGRITKNNLPGMSDNPVVHIRPKAKDGNDKVELPLGNLITKQAYWINNSYIAEILKDLPELNFNVQDNKLFPKELSIEELKLLKSKLSRRVYTLQEFLEVGNQVLPDFKEMDINIRNLSKIKFKIDNVFILPDEIKSIDIYLDELIFENTYFTVPDNMLFSTSYVKRKLENLENAYKLLQVENGLYITESNFKRNGLKKSTFVAYKEDVENFVGGETFFTLSTLSNRGFVHDLEEYGFEDFFYEAILKRPGRLKFLKIAQTTIFVKSKRSKNINDFIGYILEAQEALSIEKFILTAAEKCHIKMEHDQVIKLMKNSSFFYSSEMETLFRDKDIFYSNIYGK